MSCNSISGDARLGHLGRHAHVIRRFKKNFPLRDATGSESPRGRGLERMKGVWRDEKLFPCPLTVRDRGPYDVKSRTCLSTRTCVACPLSRAMA